MCIRDSDRPVSGAGPPGRAEYPGVVAYPGVGDRGDLPDHFCLLYTSDAADERSSVDLGGRRIIKKTNKRWYVWCT